MRVLISGAGPAGLTVAYWLKKYGFRPTLIELAPQLRTGGYKLDVRGSAIEMMRRMGIYDDVRKASTDMQGALLVDKDGKILHKMTGDDFGHREGDDLEIMRGALCQILLDKIPDVEIIYGDSIQGILQEKDSVTVKFKKNESRIFDLIIGADGIHSRVRKLVFGEESQFAHKLGVICSTFTIPNFLNLDRIEMQYTGFGKAAILWNTRGDSDVRASFAFISHNQVEPKDTLAQQKLIRHVFKEIGGEVPKMLELMPSTQDFYFDDATQIRMDRYSQDRVVLLGDAGYCPSPVSGQGLSQGIVGGYVLAGELAAAKGDYKTAFDQYEKEMRPFVLLNQQLGIHSAAFFKSLEKKSLSTWLFGKLMSLAPTKLIASYFIHSATRRIQHVANSIKLKDYPEKECLSSNASSSVKALSSRSAAVFSISARAVTNRESSCASSLEKRSSSITTKIKKYK